MERLLPTQRKLLESLTAPLKDSHYFVSSSPLTLPSGTRLTGTGMMEDTAEHVDWQGISGQLGALADMGLVQATTLQGNEGMTRWEITSQGAAAIQRGLQNVIVID